MATLMKRPNVRSVRAKSGGSEKKWWWLAVLQLAACVSSALGLVMAVALLVYITPRRADQIVAELYSQRQWYGPDWIAFMNFGMFAAVVLGAIGLVISVTSMVFAARVKDQKANDWGCAVLGFVVPALVFILFIDSLILHIPVLP